MPASDLQDLLDRAAIHDVHARYFQGLDRGDPDQLRQCFSEDVVAYYDGRSTLRPGTGEPIRGVDAVIGSLHTFKSQKAGDWKVTSHFMGNMVFRSIEGDAAETETYAVAYLVLARQPTDLVAMRGLRYLDRLRRTPSGWRISERLHTLDWSCEVPVTFATTMAERQMDHRDSPTGQA
jgi:hypothetical protein